MSSLRPTPRLRRLRKSEEGQALVLASLGIVVLLMMAGLGVDVGYLKYQKQQMQKAADAGALAAATALINYGTGNPQIVTAGQYDAASNGFANGNGITVTVNNPPQTPGDPFLGNLGYVEVIVSQAQPTFFMRLAGYNSVNVSSRAVATAIGSGSACVYSLSPSGNDMLTIAVSKISSNCGILVNSASKTALDISSGDIVPYSIGVVGDCTGTGGQCQQLGQGQGDENILTQNIAPFTDPLANLPSPAVPPGCSQTGYSKNLTGQPLHLSSGTYCGGITLNGTGIVDFEPGTYYLVGGGLNISGGTPTLNGTGVTFYNTANSGNPYGPISITGLPTGAGPTGSLSAPTDGSMAGILFYQDRNVGYNLQPNIINGAGNGARSMTYTGTLYFPTTGLVYTGGGQALYELLVAWKLNLSGNIVLENHYSSLPNGASPIANAMLVE